MRKFLIAALFNGLCIFSASCSEDIPATIRIPSQCSVREQWFTPTTTYEIVDRNGIVGTVRKHPIDYSFEFLDANSAIQGNLSMIKGIPQGYFILNDVEGKCVGDLREEGEFLHKYSFIAPNGRVIAIASQNFWGSKYTIINPETHYLYATVTKYFLRKKWGINIEDPIASYYQGIDPRLYVVLVAVEQSRADWQRFIIDPMSKNLCELTAHVKSISAFNCSSQMSNEITDEDIEVVETLTESMLIGISHDDTSAALNILNPLLQTEDTRLTVKQKLALQLMLGEYLK